MTTGTVVKVDGADWRVLGVGVTENGAVYVHLASLTEGVKQRNGWRPLQCCGWWREGQLCESPYD